MSHITLKIEGMSCGHCVMAVKQALEDLDGVTGANVTIGSAAVEYDPDIVSPDEIAAAVDESGYTATPAG